MCLGVLSVVDLMERTWIGIWCCDAGPRPRWLLSWGWTVPRCLATSRIMCCRGWRRRCWWRPLMWRSATLWRLSSGSMAPQRASSSAGPDRLLRCTPPRAVKRHGVVADNCPQGGRGLGGRRGRNSMSCDAYRPFRPPPTHQIAVNEARSRSRRRRSPLPQYRGGDERERADSPDPATLTWPRTSEEVARTPAITDMYRVSDLGTQWRLILGGSK